MSYTVLRSEITDYVKGKMLQDGGYIFNFFKNNVDYTFGANVGKIDVPLMTGVSTSTPDGTTTLAESVSNTLVSLTVVEDAASHWVNAKNEKSWDDGNPTFLQSYMDMAVDSFNVKADDQMNDAIEAVTPATSITIPAGYANFAIDTTSIDTINASAFLINGVIAEMIGGMAVNDQGMIGGDTMILKVAKTAWLNLLKLATSSFDRAVALSGINYNATDKRLYWNGVPIFLSAATEENNWGVVSKSCIYGVHKRSYALIMDRAYIQAGGLQYDGTGVPKLVLMGVWAQGSINVDLLSEGVNSTS